MYIEMEEAATAKEGNNLFYLMAFVCAQIACGN